MYYSLKKDCYIRKIGKYGYIKRIGIYNDLFFDESGSIFLSNLTRMPIACEELAYLISKSFKDIKSDDILNDVIDFFDELVDNGFVVKGNTEEECINNNVGFRYSDLNTDIYDFSPKKILSDNTSQSIFDNYIKEHPYLSAFQIELTSKCNERCIHCYIPHEYKNNDINAELYYSLLDQLKELGTIGITLSGGEPMSHPKFKEFVKAAKERDFFINILSNLTLLDDDIIATIKEGNVCSFQVSLYSMIPEHHDTITALKGSFEKTKNNIIKLIENDIPLQINCPVMKANKDDVGDVIRWGHEHKVRVNVDYSIMAEYDHRTDNLAHRLDPQEAKDVIKQIINEDLEYRKQLLDENFEENTRKALESKDNNNEIFCGVGRSTACMVANGNVYPCPGWQSYICGNLNNDSLKNIWYLSKEMNYLRNLKKHDIKKCNNCDDKAFCSPCLSRFANESKTGNPLEVANHFCEVAKVNKEVVTKWKKEISRK